MPLEFRELRYFVVLCEELHFGRAAARLHLSQSPLSQAIAQLERKLGTKLLDRSSRHVQVTDAGSVLLEHGRRLLREADEAVGATRRAAGGEVGSIRIVATDVGRNAVVPALLHALDDRVPNLTVDVVELDGDEIVQSVLHGAADAALMAFAPISDEVGAKRLRRDPPVAVFRPGHPLADRTSVTTAELARHTLILPPRRVSKGAHDAVLVMFHPEQPAAVRIADIHSGASWDAMHTADGFAIASAAAAVSGDLVTVPIENANLEFSISLVWSRTTPPIVLPALLEAADAMIAENGWD
jgi:DNA-binding transcriptional LysR family regulator